jgi:hypothetical protein
VARNAFTNAAHGLPPDCTTDAGRAWRGFSLEEEEGEEEDGELRRTAFVMSVVSRGLLASEILPDLSTYRTVGTLVTGVDADIGVFSYVDASILTILALRPCVLHSCFHMGIYVVQCGQVRENTSMTVSGPFSITEFMARISRGDPDFSCRTCAFDCFLVFLDCFLVLAILYSGYR